MEQRLKVAVPAPIDVALDYDARDFPHVVAGTPVQVPLGRRQVVGIAITPVQDTAADGMECRPVLSVLDHVPPLPADVLALCDWAARYYHHPPGEVLALALPGQLRRPKAVRARSRARKPAQDAPLQPAPAPTPDQAAVLAALRAEPAGFQVGLLEGVTGSGKTEVYLGRIADVLSAGGRALVLTPEIGLTPQLLARFQARLGDAVTCLHSGLTEAERVRRWLAIARGEVSVVIGTRSAVFTPIPKLALVVIDEEHDVSFKQQDGLRYSARDVAIKRAQLAGVPVLLGSATPSLETLHNAARGRYRHHRLAARAAARQLPKLELLDLRGQRLVEGFAPRLLERIDTHLHRGGQALLFVNRRGYAPTLLCHDCGWTARCTHCDARLTWHRGRARLVCHHCTSEHAVPARCGACGASRLIPVGEGTERIEDALRARFTGFCVERVDSDRMRRAGELERVLEGVHARTVHLLVGTQMLAKGHDFPGLSLVGVLNADEALYSTDFRAIERMGQLLTQVSGRAGRGDTPGEVLVQTHAPDHPGLQTWLREGYAGLARMLLDERRVHALPPFAHLALVRADALDRDRPLALLRGLAAVLDPGAAEALGPVPAPMERRAARYRAQLLLRSPRRDALHAVLEQARAWLTTQPEARRMRWSIDVDPLDLY